MAQKTIVQLTDDIDGGEASQTVRFGLDGTVYEIDLNESNAAKLREAISAYTSAGRKTSAGSRTRGTRAAAGYDPKAVRAWASSNKVSIPARGRIPLVILERYRAAGN